MSVSALPNEKRNAPGMYGSRSPSLSSRTTGTFLSDLEPCNAFLFFRDLAFPARQEAQVLSSLLVALDGFERKQESKRF